MRGYQVPTRLPGAPTSHYTELSEITEDSGTREDGRRSPIRRRSPSSWRSSSPTTGMQRMTARVLATLLFTEQPTMTAGELARAAAGQFGRDLGRGQDAHVRRLWSSGCPAPASRRDHYRLRDNAWAIQYTNQNEVIVGGAKAAEAGIAATDGRQPGPPTSHPDARLLQLPVRGDSGAARPLVSAIGVAPRRSPPSLGLVGYLESS